MNTLKECFDDGIRVIVNTKLEEEELFRACDDLGIKWQSQHKMSEWSPPQYNFDKWTPFWVSLGGYKGTLIYGALRLFDEERINWSDISRVPSHRFNY